MTETDPWDGDDRLPGYFGVSWETVSRYHELLREHGGTRGLLGPRESARLWERHLLNCAAVVPLLADSGEIVDIGSGAGLPGIVIAAMLPTTRVILLESMKRRTDWLIEVSAELGLRNVEVVRGRAETMTGRRRASAVTARAVASLGDLASWSAPLLNEHGRLVALKGRRAAEEVAESVGAMKRAGFRSVTVESLPSLAGAEATTVVVARRAENGD